MGRHPVRKTAARRDVHSVERPKKRRNGVTMLPPIARRVPPLRDYANRVAEIPQGARGNPTSSFCGEARDTVSMRRHRRFAFPPSLSRIAFRFRERVALEKCRNDVATIGGGGEEGSLRDDGLTKIDGMLNGRFLA